MNFVCSEKRGSSPKVLLIGLRHASKMVAYWLCKYGLSVRMGGIRSVLKPKDYHIIHFIYSPTIKIRGPFLLLFLKASGKKVIVHWAGSDVMSLLTRRKMQILNNIAKRFVDEHLACSPWLCKELELIGIKSISVPLLSNLKANVTPLPDEPAMLFYLPEKRYDFYGGRILEKLAADFPEVKFLVVANTGKGCKKRDNIEFLGYIPYREMSEVYRGVYGLIRLPLHDGLSMMVVEALLHGRYVIYSKKLKYCFYARSYGEVKNYVKKIVEMNEPNYKGANFAGELILYSVRQLLATYSKLLGELG